MFNDVEFNIGGVPKVVVSNMKKIAKNNGVMSFHYAADRLVLTSDAGYFGKLSKTIEEISEMCKKHGVDYESLLDLD